MAMAMAMAIAMAIADIERLGSSSHIHSFLIRVGSESGIVSCLTFAHSAGVYLSISMYVKANSRQCHWSDRTSDWIGLPRKTIKHALSKDCGFC